MPREALKSHESPGSGSNAGSASASSTPTWWRTFAAGSPWRTASSATIAALAPTAHRQSMPEFATLRPSARW